MSITANVINDTIKLPEGVHLEDQTEVIITTKNISRPTLAARFKDLTGAAGSGIGDLADNHEHYLYGLPKSRA